MLVVWDLEIKWGEKYQANSKFAKTRKCEKWGSSPSTAAERQNEVTQKSIYVRKIVEEAVALWMGNKLFYFRTANKPQEDEEEM